jgi:hypothetical protein
MQACLNRSMHKYPFAMPEATLCTEVTGTPCATSGHRNYHRDLLSSPWFFAFISLPKMPA